MSPRLLIGILLALILLIGLGIGGYFAFIEADKQHKKNVEELGDFGTTVIPVRGGGGEDSISIGTEGQVQLPPDIPEKDLSPTEKVIIALSREKENLFGELQDARGRIAKLERELAVLRDYRSENERYAPLPLSEERLRALEELQELLASSEDADRFDDFQKRAMALAAARAYLKILREYRLSFSEAEKDEILAEHLPAYAFCIGPELGFVPNGETERRRLLAHLEEGEKVSLDAALASDLDQVLSPCLRQLDKRIEQLL